MFSNQELLSVRRKEAALDSWSTPLQLHIAAAVHRIIVQEIYLDVLLVRAYLAVLPDLYIFFDCKIWYQIIKLEDKP